MIKNATLWQIKGSWDSSLTGMEFATRANQFFPCGATQDKAAGWVPPRGDEHGALVESINGWRVLRYMIETKAVPGAAVRKKAQEAADKIEADTGRRPGKKETRALREDARLELMPHAFARQSTVWVLVNLVEGLLITDAATQGKADEVASSLVQAFDGLVLRLLNTQHTPQTGMTQWLLAESPDDWPEGFHVERECELRSHDEDKSIVRFSRHHLVNDEIRKHIAEGKLPTRLAMSWEGRVGFVLTTNMQLKKISFLEGVLDSTSDAYADCQDAFEADWALTVGELGQLLPALVDALGGELEAGDTA